MRQRGFSIVELMVAVALMALLLGHAGPSFTLWVRNAQVRAMSDALQNALRTAQAEAVRRQRQVVFFRTANATCNLGTTASATGTFWVVRSVSLVAGDAAENIQCGVLSDTVDGVAMTGPAALCFSGIGRLTDNADPGIGGTACQRPPTGVSSFTLSSAQADRPLNVLVSLAGSVRMCDPARTLSASTPDGCP